MLLGNANCLNWHKYKMPINACLSCVLCEDVVDIILPYLELVYKKEYEELLRFRSKTHTIQLQLNENNTSLGFKFSGARNDKVGYIKMFGIFISDIKDNSAAADFMYLHKKDYRGFQVIEHNWIWQFLPEPEKRTLDLSWRYGTLKNLKRYQKCHPSSIISLKLEWNPELLNIYNYDIDI